MRRGVSHPLLAGAEGAGDDVNVAGLEFVLEVAVTCKGSRRLLHAGWVPVPGAGVEGVVP